MGCCVSAVFKDLCFSSKSPSNSDLLRFEFGLPNVYLAWRVGCFILWSLLLLTYPQEYRANESVYMHGWLAVLLAVGLAWETFAMVVTRFCVRFCPTACGEYAELSPLLRCVWYQYDVIYPNIFSSALMYFFVLGFQTTSIKNLTAVTNLQNVAEFYALVHVVTTATPSHVCHVFMPMVLTLLHIFYTYLWYLVVSTIDSTLKDVLPKTTTTASSSTNILLDKPTAAALPDADIVRVDTMNAKAISTNDMNGVISGYFGVNNVPLNVYPGLDWTNTTSALAKACLWLLLTAVCYFGIVMCAYIRREIFKHAYTDPNVTKETISMLDNVNSTTTNKTISLDAQNLQTVNSSIHGTKSDGHGFPSTQSGTQQLDRRFKPSMMGDSATGGVVPRPSHLRQTHNVPYHQGLKSAASLASKGTEYVSNSARQVPYQQGLRSAASLASKGADYVSNSARQVPYQQGLNSAASLASKGAGYVSDSVRQFPYQQGLNSAPSLASKGAGYVNDNARQIPYQQGLKSTASLASKGAGYVNDRTRTVPYQQGLKSTASLART